MPDPIYSPGSNVDLHEPLQLYRSLFVMQTEGDPEEFPAGEYAVEDVIRDVTGRHDDKSDGYSYCLRGPDGRLGWECEAGIDYFQLAEDRRDEDFEFFPYRMDTEPDHKIGSHVKLMKKFSAWVHLHDIGWRSSSSGDRGLYRIVDAGEVNTDDELDISVDNPFVIYAIEREQRTKGEKTKRIWVAERILDAALEK